LNKVSDFIIIESSPQLKMEIQELADKKHVRMTTTKRGYRLEGNAAAVNATASLIRTIELDILSIKMFEHKEDQYIIGKYWCLLPILRELETEFKATIFLLSSTEYYLKYKKLLGVDKERKKSCLRIILYGPNFKTTPNLEKKFHSFFQEKCQQISERFVIEDVGRFSGSQTSKLWQKATSLSYNNKLLKQLCSKKLDNLAKSHLKLIEEDRSWTKALQKQCQVIITPHNKDSSQLKERFGIENKEGKSLVLVEGNITKVNADAIVNSTDLRFQNGQSIQGVAKEIYEKAGDTYALECLEHPKLGEGEVFVSGPGRLTNCKKIFNFSGPIYTSDSELQKKLDILDKGVRALFAEASQHNISTIAIPFVSSGNFGLKSSGINTLLEALVND